MFNWPHMDRGVKLYHLLTKHVFCDAALPLAYEPNMSLSIQP